MYNTVYSADIAIAATAAAIAATAATTATYAAISAAAIGGSAKDSRKQPCCKFGR